MEQGYSRVEAARNLDISANILRRWIKQSQDDQGQAFRGNGKRTPEQAEVRHLQEEVRRLKMEKEIVKKALVCFAKETK